MSKVFFLKSFIINYVLHFMYRIFSENLFNQKFPLQEIYNNNKAKVKIL